MLTHLFIGSLSCLKSTSVARISIVLTFSVVPLRSADNRHSYDTSHTSTVDVAPIWIPVSKGHFCAVSIEPLIRVAVLLLVTFENDN